MAGLEREASLSTTLFGVWRLEALFHKEAREASMLYVSLSRKPWLLICFSKHHFLLDPTAPSQQILDVYIWPVLC